MTTKVTKFTGSTSQAFVAALENHLKSFAEEHGVNIKTGRWVYNEGMVEMRGLNFALARADGTDTNTDMLKTYLMMAGVIVAGDTRTVFESREYILMDYKPKAYKRPWVVKSKLDGKSYVISDTSAKIHFAAK